VRSRGVGAALGWLRVGRGREAVAGGAKRGGPLGRSLRTDRPTSGWDGRGRLRGTACPGRFARRPCAGSVWEVARGRSPRPGPGLDHLCSHAPSSSKPRAPLEPHLSRTRARRDRAGQRQRPNPPMPSSSCSSWATWLVPRVRQTPRASPSDDHRGPRWTMEFGSRVYYAPRERKHGTVHIHRGTSESGSMNFQSKLAATVHHGHHPFRLSPCLLITAVLAGCQTQAARSDAAQVDAKSSETGTSKDANIDSSVSVRHDGGHSAADALADVLPGQPSEDTASDAACSHQNGPCVVDAAISMCCAGMTCTNNVCDPTTK